MGQAINPHLGGCAAKKQIPISRWQTVPPPRGMRGKGFATVNGYGPSGPPSGYWRRQLSGGGSAIPGQGSGVHDVSGPVLEETLDITNHGVHQP